MSKLAIIGTAGRGPDGKQLASDPERYLTRMLDAARKVSELTGATELISGGAAWADHVAVLLFLEDPLHYSIELEIPAALVSDGKEGCQYDDKGTGDFKNNPGGVSNHYHRLFKRAFAKTRAEWSPFIDFDSLHVNALNYGVPDEKITINVGTGFLERNLVVAAKAHHCLAMTFGEGPRLKDGGTAHTMSNFLAKRDHGQAWHLDLNTLKLYPNATVS